MGELKRYTAEEFRAEYIDCLEERIKGYQRCLDNENFLKVLALEDIHFCFHPLGYSNTTFVDKCELYNELSYALDDDGEMSFVRVDWQYLNVAMSTILKKPLEKCIYKRTEYLCVRGYYNTLDESMLLEQASKYNSFDVESNPKLTKYKSRYLDWKLLDVIDGYKNLIKDLDDYPTIPHGISTLTLRHNITVRTDIENNANLLFDDYIDSTKHKFEKKIK